MGATGPACRVRKPVEGLNVLGEFEERAGFCVARKEEVCA
jgi:hypothetical protein